MLSKLTGVVALAWVAMRPGLLLPGLLAVPSSGCCNCEELNHLRVNSQIGVSMLEISSSSCTDAQCTWESAEGCRQFEFDLVAVGGCSMLFTAVNGRQASLDVGVSAAGTTCCGGPRYTTGFPTDDSGAEIAAVTFPMP